MARNFAKASCVVLLPVGDSVSGAVPGATRLKALLAADLSPDGPGVEMESFAKGLALRVGAGASGGGQRSIQHDSDTRVVIFAKGVRRSCGSQ